MPAKKVLIITYYWPPSGGAGVQRWLKFTKYLREFGWEPIIFTVANGEFPEIDSSLEKDVPADLEIITQAIREPYLLYKYFTGKKKKDKIHAGFLSEKKNPGILQNLAVWIRGNLFIPDARMLWIKPSIKTLSDYLKKNNDVDVVVSTGPPHSCHLIALALKKKHGLKWLADFRDPWTNIDFYKDLKLTKRADARHHYLEKEVITTADAVVAIGKTMQEEFSATFNREIHCITNGFDTNDAPTATPMPDRKFSIAHIGTMVKTRNPIVLWKALNELLSEIPELKNDLEIKLVGKTDVEAIDSLKQYELTPFVNRMDYLSHNEVIKIQQQSQVLLLMVNNTPNAKGVITGKIFEYLLAKRPILCIGPEDGDAADIIKKTDAGFTAGFEDVLATKKIVADYYLKFKQKNLVSTSQNIEQFNRKNLTQELSVLLNTIGKHD